MKKRLPYYGAAGVVALVAFAINGVSVHGLERELQAIADKKISEFRAEEPEALRERMQIGATVVAAKSYILFGEVSGKIAVYLRHSPEADARMEGFEFFFAREPETGWRQTESGVCSSEECTQEGLEVLRKLNAQ